MRYDYGLLQILPNIFKRRRQETRPASLKMIKLNRSFDKQEQRFMAINFGTDGWRAVISDTFTFDNLRIVSQAVADAVQSGTWLKLSKVEKVENPNRIVIGYDKIGRAHV